MSYARRHMLVLSVSLLVPTAFLAQTSLTTAKAPARAAGEQSAGKKTALPETPAPTGLIPPAELKVGNNLQNFSRLKLAKMAPESGLVITVISDDPTRMLLALAPDQAGSKSITLKVNPRYTETPDFCVQGLTDEGTATYTATAPGFNSVQGKVVLTRSAILMAGPSKQSAFKTTPSQMSNITFFSTQVNGDGSVEQQQIAGGRTVNIEVTSSDPKVGDVIAPSVTMKGGEASAITGFQPTAAGTTTLAMKIPPGFSAAPKMATVAATIDLPGIGITGEINLGKDLQIVSTLLLGEAAPAEGLNVTLTSSDPEKLVISAKEDEAGSKSVTIHVPAGQLRATCYLQALVESGTVNYTATAPGFRPRVAPVYLAPSGILLVYTPYGAPDRAEVQRDTRDPRPFTTKLSSKEAAVKLSLWVVYLDRDTHRGADITVQTLRPGVTPTVELKSSNPDVATVPASVTIKPLSHNMHVDATVLTAGKTVFSVSTPAGFTTPTNATTVYNCTP